MRQDEQKLDPTCICFKNFKLKLDPTYICFKFFKSTYFVLYLHMFIFGTEQDLRTT
jgi:hypothetical protein